MLTGSYVSINPIDVACWYRTINGVMTFESLMDGYECNSRATTEPVKLESAA